MATIQVFEPVRRPVGGHPVGRLADRRRDVAGAQLTLIDNSKPNSKEALQHLGHLLRGRLGLGSVEVVSKPDASRPILPDEARAMAARSRLVLTGVGD